MFLQKWKRVNYPKGSYDKADILVDCRLYLYYFIKHY